MATGDAVDEIALGSSLMPTDHLDSTLARDPGDDFEQACWGLLCRRYRQEDLQYIPAAVGGDCGIEGFSTDGLVYQCYADRDSLTLRHRTDKQKKKLYTDTCKLRSEAKRIVKLLGGMRVKHYILLVPEFHAAELIAYAATRSKAVRAYGLPFIDDGFGIKIKTPEDYPGELRAALADGAAKAVVDVSEVDSRHVALFADEKPELVKVLEEKLEVLGAASPGADIAVVRDQLIRAFLAKEQVMEGLREWPDTWEAVERRRQLKQDALELESELSPDAPDRRMLTLVRDYQADLVSSVPAMRDADAQRVAIGQAGEWLMRCPLRFRTPA